MDDGYAKKLFDLILCVDYSDLELDVEMTRNERRLLTVLLNAQKPITVGEAGAILKTTKPLTSQTVSRLEKRGFVKRSWSKADRRKIILNTTNKGLTALDSTKTKTIALIDSMLSRLSDEENKILIELATKAIKPENKEGDSTSNL